VSRAEAETIVPTGTKAKRVARNRMQRSVQTQSESRRRLLRLDEIALHIFLSNGQTAAQFAARRFVANAAVQASANSANDVQLSFTHRALQTKQQAIIEQRWMIDSVVFSGLPVGACFASICRRPACRPVHIVRADDTVGVVPRQARSFQAEDDAYVG